MGAEFYVSSPQPDWLARGEARIRAHIGTLPTWVGHSGETGQALCLQGFEGRGEPGRWAHDVRLLFGTDGRLLIEISAQPPSIARDVHALCSWLRAQFNARVLDEDGEPSAW